jgi:hypothetical protein
VVTRARREHFDVPPTRREPRGHLPEHGLGTTDDLGAVSRRHKTETPGTVDGANAVVSSHSVTARHALRC